MSGQARSHGPLRGSQAGVVAAPAAAGRESTHASSRICDRSIIDLMLVYMRQKPAPRRAALVLVSLCLCCGLAATDGGDLHSSVDALFRGEGLTAADLLQVRAGTGPAPPAPLLIASLHLLDVAPCILRRPASCSSCGSRLGGGGSGRRCPARLHPTSNCAGLCYALERRWLRLRQALPLPVRRWASLGCVDCSMWSPSAFCRRRPSSAGSIGAASVPACSQPAPLVITSLPAPTQADARGPSVVPAAQLQRGADPDGRARCGCRLGGGGAPAVRRAGALLAARPLRPDWQQHIRRFSVHDRSQGCTAADGHAAAEQPLLVPPGACRPTTWPASCRASSLSCKARWDVPSAS